MYCSLIGIMMYFLSKRSNLFVHFRTAAYDSLQGAKPLAGESEHNWESTTHSTPLGPRLVVNFL